MSGSVYRQSPVPLPEVAGGFAAKVYTWMTGMLLVTAGTSIVAHNMGMVPWFQHHMGWFLAALGLELVLVAAFAGLRKSMRFVTGLILLAAYTILNGLTMSVVLAKYQWTTVALSFFLTSGVFTLASIYGHVTKRSLEGIGEWLFLALLGLVGAMVGNLFLHSRPMDYVISCVAVLVFCGLALYDSQKIKDLAAKNPSALAALDCALEVYLDFLNIFPHLLRLLGGPKTGKDD